MEKKSRILEGLKRCCKKTCSATKAAIQRGIVEAISQTKVGRLAMLIMQQGGADYGQG